LSEKSFCLMINLKGLNFVWENIFTRKKIWSINFQFIFKVFMGNDMNFIFGKKILVCYFLFLNLSYYIALLIKKSICFLLHCNSLFSATFSPSWIHSSPPRPYSFKRFGCTLRPPPSNSQACWFLGSFSLRQIEMGIIHMLNWLKNYCYQFANDALLLLMYCNDVSFSPLRNWMLSCYSGMGYFKLQRIELCCSRVSFSSCFIFQSQIIYFLVIGLKLVVYRIEFVEFV
jgi:hypothetical protein